jgi:hypothetical protein
MLTILPFVGKRVLFRVHTASREGGVKFTASLNSINTWK